MAVTVIPFDPVADLCVLQWCDADCHVVILLDPIEIHPLVSRKYADYFPFPVVFVRQPQLGVHTGAAGAGLGITVLVNEMGRLVDDGAKPIH